MIIHILTLFPELLEAFFRESIPGRAVEKGLLEVNLVDIRDFAEGKHRVVDDRPFGGGPGMVLKPEPVFAAVEHTLKGARSSDPRMILLTPQGRRFDQDKAIELSEIEECIMLCGRYEGFDERILTGFPWEDLSIGDFVLSGGEVAAMCVIEATIRLQPGILGDEESAARDSFMDGLLGPPQYTRPRSFRNEEVPEILLSGDHAAIEAWRRKKALKRTQDNRPDLIEGKGPQSKKGNTDHEPHS